MVRTAEPDSRPPDLPPTSAQRRMLGSPATRYLSAGVYLDPPFRNAVLRELVGSAKRSVAPAFSTDAVPVVRHALNARRNQVVRDLVLTVVLLVFLVLQAKLLLAILALTGSALLTLRAARTALRLRFLAALVLLVPALIALLIALLLLESSSGLFASIDGSSGYEEHTPFGAFLLEVIGVFVIVMGAAWTTITVERLINRQTILDHLMPGRFDPTQSPAGPRSRQARLRYIAEAQLGNVTYYPQDAAEQPFIGAGPAQHTYTRTVSLAAGGGGAAEFSTESLREALARDLAQLNGPEEVSVQDRLITPASAHSGDPRLDPATGLLRHRLPVAEMEQLTESDSTGTHRYLSVRTAPDRGQGEVWVFVRALVQGRRLHLDLVSCGLPPVRARYREIDQYAASGPGVVLRTALGVLPDLPGTFLRAPLNLVLALLGQEQLSWDLRDRLRQLGTSDERGAHASVRELGTDQESGNLMAGFAAQRQIRVIEQQIIETVAASMENAGLDPEEFHRRTQVILDGTDQ
ncbi:hypothetical protein [Kineosporia babensis]|uniref:Uncharacterized protein n=1 Tax=Kineosporia babensis TaxID=499548 RepID=A0A9X1NJH7_9ACTN|nr:hypothetical protein [Kineosporia babensis]MCD5315215.1 hypothetical protein [Kineosporia babensis]